MKILLLFATGLTLAILAPSQGTAAGAEQLRCNYNAWPAFSAIPCRAPPGVTTYAQCLKLAKGLGWDSNVLWWYCSNIGVKS